LFFSFDKKRNTTAPQINGKAVFLMLIVAYCKTKYFDSYYIREISARSDIGGYLFWRLTVLKIN
jgi:general stress protein CsbA